MRRWIYLILPWLPSILLGWAALGSLTPIPSTPRPTVMASPTSVTCLNPTPVQGSFPGDIHCAVPQK